MFTGLLPLLLLPEWLSLLLLALLLLVVVVVVVAAATAAEMGRALGRRVPAVGVVLLPLLLMLLLLLVLLLAPCLRLLGLPRLIEVLDLPFASLRVMREDEGEALERRLLLLLVLPLVLVLVLLRGAENDRDAAARS